MAAERLVPERPRSSTLVVEGLRIDRKTTEGPRAIVTSLEMSVADGETIGIVGESGSGKSMTARAITGLLPPGLEARGEVRYDGRNLLELSERQWRAIRGREIGLILQDPFTMLNPVLRCGRIIEESLAGDRSPRRTRHTEAVRRLREVGITDEAVANRYPFQLSGGMRQRVAIAAALARDPQVLIADEPSTALDVTTQREILTLIKSIQVRRGMSLILITHDLRIAFAVCDRIYVLYAGSLVEVGPSLRVESEPLHPYTHGLLLSEPPSDRRVNALVTIPGSVPEPHQVTGRCTFAPRCNWAKPVCTDSAPPLREVEEDRLSACVRLPEIRDEMKKLRDGLQQDEVGVADQRAAEPLVQMRDVRKVFRAGGRLVTAVDSVSIEIGEGESVGLVGESGSGKSTIARMLVGLESATEGEILIGGISASDWAGLTAKDRRKLRGIVQIVFQDPYSSLNPMRSIGWTLREAILTHDRAARDVERRATALLASVGLPSSYAQRRPVALSGGERQRVAIARSLAAEPRILICDEPVSALDVSVQAQVLNLLTELRATRGIGYLFITHDLSIVRQISERLYVMHRGRVIESGLTDRVLSAPQQSYTIELMKSVPRADLDWLAPRAQAGNSSAS